MLLSSNVALIGGNSTKPGSSYYALIKAVPLIKAALSLYLLLRGDTFIEVRVQAVRLKLRPLAAVRLTLAL